jgi:hypothetical protein
MSNIERNVEGMKRDARALGQEYKNSTDREKAEALDNLREHVQDLRGVRDLRSTIVKPFVEGAR